MRIKHDNLLLCADCLQAAVNDDYTGLDYALAGHDADARAETIREGLRALGAGLVPDFDSETNDGIDEFSRTPCACCKTRLAGKRHRFATLEAA
jgi:hypothetical protein